MPDATSIMGGLISARTNEVSVAKEISYNMRSFLIAGGPELLSGADRQLSEIAVKYHDQTSEFLSKDDLDSVLQVRNISDDGKTAIRMSFALAVTNPISSPVFIWRLGQLEERLGARKLADALIKTSVILEGKMESKDSVTYSGFRDAERFLSAELSALSGGTKKQEAPGGDVRKDKVEILEEIENAENGITDAAVVRTGFHFIDSATNGLRRGNFVLVGAYTAEGKSQFCTNLAYHFSVEEGKNILVISTEMDRSSYRRRIVTRHTSSVRVGCPNGIPYNTVQTARWKNDDERALFVRCVEDLTTNPLYGVLSVDQATCGSTIDDIMRLAQNFQRANNKQLDVVIVDYLAMISSSKKRNSRREELVEIMERFKEFLLTFNGGRGLVGIAAHQMSRDAKKLAEPEEGKFYQLSGFADTSSAERSVDVALALLQTKELKCRHELAAGLLKVRDGECNPRINFLRENFASSFIGNGIGHEETTSL